MCCCVHSILLLCLICGWNYVPSQQPGKRGITTYVKIGCSLQKKIYLNSRVYERKLLVVFYCESQTLEKTEGADMCVLWLVCYSAVNIHLTEMSHFPFRQHISYPEELSLHLQHAGG